MLWAQISIFLSSYFGLAPIYGFFHDTKHVNVMGTKGNVQIFMYEFFFQCAQSYKCQNTTYFCTGLDAMYWCQAYSESVRKSECFSIILTVDVICQV